MKNNIKLLCSVLLLTGSTLANAENYIMRVVIDGLRPNSAASTASAPYTFNGATFTPCGATNNVGPTLAQCQTAYSGYSWAKNSAAFTVGSSATQGYQYWTAPQSGIYQLTLAGAAGANGTYAAGNGAIVRAPLQLTQGDVLTLIIGQQPVGYSNDSGGGGGGTFVYKGSTLLFAAGGGGGGGGNDGQGDGGPGSSASVTTAGTSTLGGTAGNYGAAGAGTTTAGAAAGSPYGGAAPATGGATFSGGFVGGTSSVAPAGYGGFGGGGGSYVANGGGGGGYGGGNGGGGYYGGSAGTSFLGTGGSFTGSANSGNGYVTIGNPQ